LAGAIEAIAERAEKRVAVAEKATTDAKDGSSRLMLLLQVRLF